MCCIDLIILGLFYIGAGFAKEFSILYREMEKHCSAKAKLFDEIERSL